MASELHARHLTPETPGQAPNLTPPPGNPRFALFDGLRAIAALSVFFGHTITGLYAFTQGTDRFLIAVQLAYQGVGIFFLISGFLLYRPFLTARREGRALPLSDYLRRRIFRIVPAYWVALSVFLATGLVSGVTAHNWWLFYGFGQIYNAQDIGRGIGVAWTLCIEMTFYAALPLFALLAARVGRNAASVRGDWTLLVVLSLASLAFRAHFHGFFDAAKVDTLAGTFTWFALGMGMAILSVEAEAARTHRDGKGPGLARFAGRHPGLAWVLVLALSAVQYELIRQSTSVAAQLLSHVLYGLIAFCLLLPAMSGSGGLARALLGSRSLTFIGVISYAFYLYHSIVIAQLNKFDAHIGLAPRYPFVLVGAFVVTLAVSSLSYYALERPIMRWGARRRRRSPAI